MQDFSSHTIIPVVAVITRTKDRPILLCRAIESVLEQSFYDWIHIIVNDGGDPDLLETTVEPYRARYGKRLRIIHKDMSGGMEAASNTGIRESVSEFIVIHDDDDCWHPDFLHCSVGYMRQSALPSEAGVITYTRFVREIIQGDDVIRIDEGAWNAFKGYRNVLFSEMMKLEYIFPPISFLYKRNVFDIIGMYDESLPVLGDFDFNLRFMANWDIGLIEKNLAFYHHRVDGAASENYQNSIIGGRSLHDRYKPVVLNKFLRKEWGCRYPNVGLLLNMISSNDSRHFGIMNELHNLTKLILKNRLLKPFFKNR